MGRENSLWFRMRNFHNNVKKKLITEVVIELRNNGIKNLSLIDVSVGRGGDLDKWFKNRINTVVGADINIESISDAESRKKKYIKGLRKESDKDLWKRFFKNYTFINISMDLRQPSYPIPYQLPDYYDIVSCQFSFHYFFQSEEILNNAIRNISNLLVPGGYFIGTAPVKVKDLLSENNGLYSLKDEYNNPVALIKRLNNNSYTFQLYDKDDAGNYFTDVKLLPEYYMDTNKMVEICKKYNMELINTKTFEELYNKLKIKPNSVMKDYEKDISFLYDQFIFKKILTFED